MTFNYTVLFIVVVTAAVVWALLTVGRAALAMVERNRARDGRDDELGRP
jgi:hypothetical protein